MQLRDRPPAKTEAMLVTRDQVATWRSPPFQRPLAINAKVQALAVELKQNGGIIPGVVTLGILEGKTYLVDGQHRMAAWEKLTDIPEVYADVRVYEFDTMADMGEQFVLLNSRLVNLRPDDILRGMEGIYAPLAQLRGKCPFVGYGQVRRGSSSPTLSMTSTLRAWYAAQRDTPSSAGVPAMLLGAELTEDSANELAEVLCILRKAWGDDTQYARLWGMLNLTISLWLWRQMVREEHSRAGGRRDHLTTAQYCKGMMALSASTDYLDWLVGRKLGEVDRGPCYTRIKVLMGARLAVELGHKPNFPQGAWVSGGYRPSIRTGA